MDPVLVLGAGLGVAIGSFGYVFFAFVARPIMRYHRIKSHIAQLFPSGKPSETTADYRRLALDLADQLQTCCDSELPAWYKQVLQNRNELPLEAVTSLQKLATTKHPDTATKHAGHILTHLKLAR
ncbi:MAG: hypothetical protein PVH30_00305 [Desulfobacterales bacterium]|jgi:hypothetical protein